MTFIIGLVWGNGILIASDSRSTSGVIATEERKLHLIFRVLNSTEYDLAVVGGSGSASLVKQSYSLIDSILGGFIEREQRLPNSAEFDKLVDEVQGTLVKRFYNLRSSGIEPDVSLILGAITAECEPRLYVFDSTGVYEPRHESPGYAMIGIGKDTDGYLLLNLLGFSKEKAGKWDYRTFLTVLKVDELA
ncbi:Ntn hydrolase family protein [Saccharolobus islandicus]|uniref:20S proteasome A and B subunits n=1 Tax=Saccharolobus islandicus (strain M.16.27) TaxID=427318 RepID=C3N5Y0_SACI3|nr:hypothetical protein [Sulfolobus islandicus]ACP55405.1 hypothetical protein M1627_1523 [Sulfolobus islandicus M.16.27]